MQFLAQSFLRGNGAPVSTWRISDDCSRSEERMGRKKWKVGNIQDTGLRHRSVSRAFGDSCTEMGCAVWGRRGRPSSSAAASFPSVDEMCFFAVRLHRPKFSVGVVSPVSGHQGRAESAVFTAREGLLARVRAPFPGRLSPASEDSPKAPLCVEEASAAWGFSRFSVRLPSDSTSHASVRWSSGPFFHPPPQGGSLNRPAWTKSFQDSPASVPRCRGLVATEHIISSLRMPVSTGSLCPAAESRTT